jgi:hypothetical protein
MDRKSCGRSKIRKSFAGVSGKFSYKREPILHKLELMLGKSSSGLPNSTA